MTMIPDERIPQAIGRYQVLKVLGAGAMGHVLLAEDPRIKRKVAIKIVRLESLRSHKDEEEYLARFQREAEISGLLNHPGIVTVYDVGEQDGVGPFMAMEFVGGQSLETLIKEGAPLPLEQKFRIASGIAEALDHAHRLGVIHRDVKPANVMLTEDGRAKLMDFGIAKREDAGLTQTGTFLGTPSYAAPEQIREGTVAPPSDQFSFAVMVFELLSGKLPFPGNSINTILYRIVNEPPADPVPPVEGIVPEVWHRVFLRALAKEPEQRYPTCSQFLRDLAEAALGAGTHIRQDLLATVPKLEGAAVPPVVASPIGAATRIGSAEPVLAPDLKTRIAPVVEIGDYSGIEEPTEPARRSSAWPWVAVVLLAAAGGGFFLWNRRAGTVVLLKTTPDKAAVTLNGRLLTESTPLQQSLRSGDHLQFESKGFQPKEMDFTQDSAWPATIALDPIVSTVELRTDPSGAQVVMDGKTLDGVTPLSVSWNEGQPHQLTFSQGALSLPKDFAVGEAPSATFQLQPPAAAEAGVSGNGTLKFVGAFPVRLKVDGVDKGELASGKSLELPPGDHKIEMANAKVFFAESRTVKVEAGKEGRIALPAMATLTVNTHPGVGDVMVDGRATGIQSDGSSVQVAAGRHTISVRSLSGKTASQPVDVQGNRSVDLPL
ncbi:MAG: protein kinase [Acidobacteria bacterium]|nr:protein kinase [Acidobacteriota bacterium]